MIRQLPNGQWVSDKFFVTPDPANPGSFILRSKKTGKTAPWSPPQEKKPESLASKLMKRPAFMEQAPTTAAFRSEHPWREDVGTLAKWGPPTAAAIATEGASPLVSIGVPAIAGVVGKLAEQGIEGKPLDIPDAAMFGATQGGIQAIGRGVPAVFEAASKLPGAPFRKAMGLATKPFGALTEDQLANRELMEWGEKEGIQIPPDVLSKSPIGTALRYYSDESLLSRGTGKKFLGKQAQQVEEAWERGVSKLGPGGSARGLGLGAERAFGTGLKNLNARIDGLYATAQELSPEAKVDMSGLAKDTIQEIRSTLLETKKNPRLAEYNKKKLEVLSLVFPTLKPGFLMKKIPKGDLTDEQIAAKSGKVDLKTARRLVSILSRIARESGDPVEKGEASSILKPLWESIYGENAKLADADPRSVSLFKRANKMYRAVKGYEENVSSFTNMRDLFNPERLAQQIKRQHVTDANVLRKVIDKYAQGGKFGPAPSQAWNGVRLAVLREAMNDPEGYGNVVFSGLKGKTERKFGQSVIHDLFSRDPAGRTIIKNIDMITELYKREPRFNPSQTGAALLTARGIRESQRLIADAVRFMSKGRGVPLAAATGGGIAMAGDPLLGAVAAGTELTVPVLMAKIIYSPRATRMLVSGLKAYPVVGRNVLPQVLRAIQFANEDFGKIVEHAASGHADVGGARYLNVPNP